MYNKFIVGCLLWVMLAVAHADPDSERVVRQFLSKMATNSSTPEVAPTIKNTLRSYISERSFKQLGISSGTNLEIDTLVFDHFEITGSFGPYVEVRAHNWVCASKPTCAFPYYTVRIKTEKVLGKSKIVPSNILSSKYSPQKYIQWHWVIIDNNYENQARVQLHVLKKTTNSNRYIEFVKEFFSLVTADNFKKTSTAEKLRYIDPQFLININVHPANVRFPQYTFKKFKVVDAFDNYVDVSVDISGCINAGNCFGQQVYRVKIKETNNQLGIVPSALNKRFMTIDFWWTEIEGHYEKPKDLSKYFQ
ncbi:hypothetical protein [Kaarinaea lacus]